MGAVANRGKDADPLLALADAAPEFQPAAKAGDMRGVRALDGDQQRVAERVAVEARAGAKPALPAFACEERSRCQLKLFELLASAGVALGDCRAAFWMCGHLVLLGWACVAWPQARTRKCATVGFPLDSDADTCRPCVSTGIEGCRCAARSRAESRLHAGPEEDGCHVNGSRSRRPSARRLGRHTRIIPALRSCFLWPSRLHSGGKT